MCSETDDLVLEFERALYAFNIPSSTLVSGSEYDPYRRVYICDDRIQKIINTQKSTTQKLRKCTPEEEYGIISILENITGTPNNIKFEVMDNFTCLSYDLIQGEALSSLKIPIYDQIMIACRLAILLFRISAKGVAHGDLLGKNVLICKGSSVVLIDFDQAEKLSLPESFIANFFGMNKGPKLIGSYLGLVGRMLKLQWGVDNSVKHNFVLALKKVVRKVAPPPLENAIRRCGQRFKHIRLTKEMSPPKLPAGAPRKLQLLVEAWDQARFADASAPGVPVCYYELWEDGYKFPGERPWQERSKYLGDCSDYEGKAILELGCNIGLLSCFLLSEKRAKSALCIDVDPRVLSAAQLVAAAYDVAPFFSCIDLDANVPWEKYLEWYQADIVFALNVLNWVRNKDRLLSFLGRFNEVIFEGHDDLDQETARLTKIGFRSIKVVATSERGRPVLRCLK